MASPIVGERSGGRIARLLLVALVAAVFIPTPAPAQSLTSENQPAYAAPSPRPVFVPGQLLVKFAPTIPLDQVERATREMGGKLLDIVTPDGLV